MQRNIILTSHAPKIGTMSATPSADDYMSRLVKLVPAEIISVYLFAFNLIKGNSKTPADGSETLQWIIFGIMLVATPIYLKKILKMESNAQVVLCTFSFLLWVFAMGGPLDGVALIGVYTVNFVGGLLVPIYTLFIPAAYK